MKDIDLELNIKKIPRHIAIIMDGNGTWAKKRGLPRNLGHRQGAKALKNIVLFSNKIGIKYLTVFAFSTENWSRPKEEVQYLMKLPLEFLKTNQKLIYDEDLKLMCIGERSRLSLELRSKILKYENETKNNKGLKFIIALNYGGKDDIIQAINRLLQEGISKVDAKQFTNYLYAKNIPDVDLLIRTSGQQRISNFLLWHLSYAELYFTKVLWPDFNENHFIKALIEYNKRERRYGGLNEN